MRKLNAIETIEQEFVHSPFFAEEIRVNDGVKAKLKVSDKWIESSVWRYSPFGVEIVVPENLSLKKGESLDVALLFQKDEVLFESLQVDSIKVVLSKSVAAFRLFAKKVDSKQEKDRRKAVRWTCPEAFLPTGTSPNPLKFNDHIIFRVEDISAGGLRLITSMRNKLIYPGQQLEASLSIPLVGNVSASLKIKYVDVVEKKMGEQYLVLGTAFSKVEPLVLKCLSEYLLHFGQDVTVTSLKKDGFPVVGGNLKSFDFTYVKSRIDYDQVLELRANSYKAAGKISADAKKEDLADSYDSRARILMVRRGDTTVGSVRVMFHPNFEESELYADGIREIPNIDFREAVEASRLCTDPQFRGLDIGYTLVSHMYLTAIKSGKRYMYGGAVGSMIDFYALLGWSVSSAQYQCSSLKNIPHKVVSVDLFEAVLGKGISAKVWRRVYRTLFEYLSEREMITPRPTDLLRLRLLSLMPDIG